MKWGFFSFLFKICTSSGGLLRDRVPVLTWSASSSSGRLFKADETTNGSGVLTVGQPLLFNSAGGDGSALEQVTVDDVTYLVKVGAGADGIYAWWSTPTTTGFAVQVNYEGAGSDDANAAIRVDVDVDAR